MVTRHTPIRRTVRAPTPEWDVGEAMLFPFAPGRPFMCLVGSDPPTFLRTGFCSILLLGSDFSLPLLILSRGHFLILFVVEGLQDLNPFEFHSA